MVHYYVLGASKHKDLMGNSSSFMVLDVCKYVLKELDELDESNKFTKSSSKSVSGLFSNPLYSSLYLFCISQN